ncbi:hypothetical protein KLEP7_gp80 [Pseudaeromonas phage vB_PpeM_ KLEP7]|nr:hypothetical protein KLEP7_gp80 [Pseudaeromonas phage vB_PpeM_ KLEP7]
MGFHRIPCNGSIPYCHTNFIYQKAIMPQSEKVKIMSNITSSQYWNEVQSLAGSIAEDAMSQCANNRGDAEELINDSLLHEMIDGHQWIIYCAYNLDVYQHSENSDYYIDNFGGDEAAYVLKEKGLDGLHQALAFWSLYADVQDKISDALDEVESNIEESDESEDDEETEE